jgi:GDPmannose 4,6-dehydratase
MQWLMLQQPQAEDFVIATGEQHSIRDFVTIAAQELDMSLEWRGEGKSEEGYDGRGNCIVQIDPRYLRPAEVDSLCGNAAKAAGKLGWKPRIGFRELVHEMVTADLQAAERDQLVKSSGYTILARHE